MINITINNKKISVEDGTSILNAAKSIGINIPTLCYHPDQEVKANCRVCVVEIDGFRTLQTACSTKVLEGMNIRTNTPKVRQARKVVIELLMANHDVSCTSCPSNHNCGLQQIAADLGIRESRFEDVLKEKPIDTSSPSIVRNPNKCISAGAAYRCVQRCRGLR